MKHTEEEIAEIKDLCGHVSYVATCPVSDLEVFRCIKKMEEYGKRKGLSEELLNKFLKINEMIKVLDKFKDMLFKKMEEEATQPADKGKDHS